MTRHPSPITGPLHADVPALRRLRGYARWVSRDRTAAAAGSIGATLLEYLNLLFLVDLTVLYFAAREIRARGAALLRVIAAVGDVDAAISIASFRTGSPALDPTAVPACRIASGFHRRAPSARGGGGTEFDHARTAARHPGHRFEHVGQDDIPPHAGRHGGARADDQHLPRNRLRRARLSRPKLHRPRATICYTGRATTWSRSRRSWRSSRRAARASRICSCSTSCFAARTRSSGSPRPKPCCAS